MESNMHDHELKLLSKPFESSMSGISGRSFRSNMRQFAVLLLECKTDSEIAGVLLSVHSHCCARTQYSESISPTVTSSTPVETFLPEMLLIESTFELIRQQTDDCHFQRSSFDEDQTDKPDANTLSSAASIEQKSSESSKIEQKTQHKPEFALPVLSSSKSVPYVQSSAPVGTSAHQGSQLHRRLVFRHGDLFDTSTDELSKADIIILETNIDCEKRLSDIINLLIRCKVGMRILTYNDLTEWFEQTQHSMPFERLPINDKVSHMQNDRISGPYCLPVLISLTDLTCAA